MEINEYEYKLLKEKESRYEWLLDSALQYASLSDTQPDELYVRGAGLREELKRYRAHDYKKKVHDLKAKQINMMGGNKYGF